MHRINRIFLKLRYHFKTRLHSTRAKRKRSSDVTLSGQVAPSGKAIVHWIGSINAIKLLN